MVRLAFREHVQAALACDRLHDAQRQVETFEHRALLDVKPQVSDSIVTSARFVDSIRIQTERGDGVSDHREQLIIDVSDQCAASDEGLAKSHALFFRESDHLNPKRQTAAVETLDQSDSYDHAQDPIKRSRARNCVEMRAYEQAARRRLRGRVEASEISCMIHDNA